MKDNKQNIDFRTPVDMNKQTQNILMVDNILKSLKELESGTIELKNYTKKMNLNEKENKTEIVINRLNDKKNKLEVKQNQQESQQETNSTEQQITEVKNNGKSFVDSLNKQQNGDEKGVLYF